VTVSGDVRTLTRVWMGDVTLPVAVSEGGLRLCGSRVLVRRFPGWLGRHPILGDIRRAVTAH
jgi:hypothetical protein